MIITNSAAVPRFSTDPIACDVSRFLSSRIVSAPSAAIEACDATGFPTTLERLYPSLFETPAASPVAAFAKLRSFVAHFRPAFHH